MSRPTRRQFLRTAALAGAVPYALSSAQPLCAQAKNDRPLVAAIGVGGRGTDILKQAARLGDVVAVCDADLANARRASELLGGKAQVYQDYRKVLDRKDVEIVTNGTPDHWHTAVNVAACRAGKDVYTEKPLALTIDEGKLLRKVVEETGRIVQVGTQQRSEANFRTACELVRNGRVGKLREVRVYLPFWTTKGGPFAARPVPSTLDWNLYQGQAPEHPYCPERTHFLFRWWSDYAGGIITDWGQHHMDIAYWGMGMEQSGPLWVEAKGNFPNAGKPDCYDNPDRFVARMKFPGDIDLVYLVVRDPKYLESMKQGDISAEQEGQLFAGLPEEVQKEQRNGIMFIGDKGRVFVNRGNLYGKAAEELKENPLPADGVHLYRSDDHMGNFFECVKSRKPNAAQVAVAHRVITACHLANVAMRVGRRINWDSREERIVGDDEAQNSRYMRRAQRAGFELRG